MKVYEADMTAKEIEKISKAYGKEISSTVFWAIVFAVAFIFFNMKNYGKSIYKLIFNLPVFLMFLSRLYRLTKLLFFDTIHQDFEEKKKIIITLIVDETFEGYSSLEGTNSAPSIQFKDNPYFRSIDVTRDSYYRISKRDKIKIELSKYGKWIINMKSGSRIIDYMNIRKSRFKKKS